MFELPENIVEMILKSCQVNLPGEEQERLDEWVKAHPERGENVEKLKKYAVSGTRLNKYRQIDMNAAWKRVDGKTGTRPGWYKRRMFVRWCMVAAVIIPCMVGIVLLSRSGHEEPALAMATLSGEPGSFKAVLELPGGDKVLLQDSREREIVTKAGDLLAKDSVNTLYVQGGKETAVEYGKIRVPAGGEYRVVLSDGTGVWINSGSELKFPTDFKGKERVVELQGEAYFDVAKDADHPFVVRTGLSAVRVLGTAFNVCSYADDAFEQVTLVRGAVEMLYGNQVYPLAPGEQFEVDKESSRVEVKKVDTELYTSWQEGVFRFWDMPLEDLVVKLNRWYNVNFFFANESCKEYRFTGAIRKDVDFAEFIDLIESVTRVKFSLKQNTVIITEK